jgi:pimeloyl-ACP methyl ester carboxylesterase
LETTIQGCKIHYELHRNADGAAPAILLLHGWGCDLTIFSFIQSSLMEKATTLALDFPGHGKSGEPEGPWDVHDYADMVRALLEQNQLAQVDVIAHSHGGRVALVLASQYPSLVRKLIITGGAGIKKPVSQSQSKRTQRFKRYNRLLERMKDVPALGDLAEEWQTRLRNHYGSPDYVKLDEVMRKTFVKLVSEDLLPVLGDIQAPTLLIWGSADTETPLWMGQQMEKNIPDAGLVIFEGRSHFAFLEEWRRFVVIAQKFLLEGEG